MVAIGTRRAGRHRGPAVLRVRRGPERGLPVRCLHSPGRPP
jgi:hypothetical protein